MGIPAYSYARRDAKIFARRLNLHVGLFRLLAGIYVARMGLMIISTLMVMRWEGLIQEQARDRALVGAERRLDEESREIDIDLRPPPQQEESDGGLGSVPKQTQLLR